MPFDGAPRVSPVSRALGAAADDIRRHGWCRGRAFGDGGAVCLRHSILAVAYSDTTKARALQKVYLAIGGRTALEDDADFRTVFATTRDEIARWNDMPGRSPADVIDLLERLSVETAMEAAQ